MPDRTRQEMQHTISRRRFNAWAASAAAIGPLGLSGCDENTSRFLPAWYRFRSRHVSATGRVIDNANGDISHSEGQGFALLLAEAAGDYASFSKIKAWTDYTLGIRDDALFAWRFLPYRSRQVPDLNNATDGDILIAWALLRASRRWQKPILAQQAKRILDDIETHCVTQSSSFGPILLPGASGFETDKTVVVNPSYYVFPAFEAFSEATGHDIWRTLTSAGLSLLDRALFGGLQLPPDWVEIVRGDTLRLAADYPPHYGWNAIRVPLYLAWAESVPNSPYLAPYKSLFERYDDVRSIPAWVDLNTNRFADFSTSRGGADIYRFIKCRSPNDPQHTVACEQLLSEPPVQPDEDYYSAALGLLARLAYYEVSPQSFQNAAISI